MSTSGNQSALSDESLHITPRISQRPPKVQWEVRRGIVRLVRTVGTLHCYDNAMSAAYYAMILSYDDHDGVVLESSVVACSGCGGSVTVSLSAYMAGLMTVRRTKP